ncbi:MAG: hypothetical protein WDN03_05670 [Rhizomicrobium sp.]
MSLGTNVLAAMELRRLFGAPAAAKAADMMCLIRTRTGDGTGARDWGQIASAVRELERLEPGSLSELACS